MFPDNFLSLNFCVVPCSVHDMHSEIHSILCSQYWVHTLDFWGATGCKNSYAQCYMQALGTVDLDRSFYGPIYAYWWMGPWSLLVIAAGASRDLGSVHNELIVLDRLSCVNWLLGQPYIKKINDLFWFALCRFNFLIIQVNHWPSIFS